MMINALIINTPISPNISLESYLPMTIPQFDSNSSDDESVSDHLSISNLNHTETDVHTWHDQLANALISLHHDMHVIITGFEELGQHSNDNLQDKKTKLELMRIALMLNPSDLSTCSNEESAFPYADLKQLDDVENSLVENQLYQHETLRAKIHRVISRLKHGMGKLRFVLFSSSYRHKSSRYTRNYRQKIRKFLEQIRDHMIEYNRINKLIDEEKQEDELTKHRTTLNHIMITIATKDPFIEERIEDYKSLLRVKGYKGGNELISSPLLLLQLESYQKPLAIENKEKDNAFHFPTLDFPDLKREANEFFDLEPFTSSDLRGVPDKNQ